jgi:hypothetical protein
VRYFFFLFFLVRPYLFPQRANRPPWWGRRPIRVSTTQLATSCVLEHHSGDCQWLGFLGNCQCWGMHWRSCRGRFLRQRSGPGRISRWFYKKKNTTASASSKQPKTWYCKQAGTSIFGKQRVKKRRMRIPWPFESNGPEAGSSVGRAIRVSRADGTTG